MRFWYCNQNSTQILNLLLILSQNEVMTEKRKFVDTLVAKFCKKLSRIGKIAYLCTQTDKRETCPGFEPGISWFVVRRLTVGPTGLAACIGMQLYNVYLTIEIPSYQKKQLMNANITYWPLWLSEPSTTHNEVDDEKKQTNATHQ